MPQFPTPHPDELPASYADDITGALAALATNPTPLSIEDFTNPHSYAVATRVMETLGEMVAIFDANLNYLYANPAYVERVCSEKPTWQDCHLLDYLPEYLHPVILPRIRQAAAGVTGIRFCVDIRDKHEQWHRIAASYYPIFNKAGKAELFVMSGLDITKLANAEQQLIALRHLSTRAQLTSGLAHDFNTLLSILTGTTFLLEHRITDPELLGHIGLMRQTIEKAISLTSQLSTYSQTHVLQPRVISVKSTLLDMKDLIRASLRSNIALTSDYTCEPDRIYADRCQFESAILNLLLNARDAMPHGGSLRIRTSPAMRTDEGGQPTVGQRADSNGVLIEITDSGIGMSNEVSAKIFEPFFTTKSNDKNSGMGLTMVQDFVKQSGGEISLSTAPNRGTCFQLYFPYSKIVESL